MPPATAATTKPTRRTSGSTPSRGAEAGAHAAEHRARAVAAERRGLRRLGPTPPRMFPLARSAARRAGQPAREQDAADRGEHGRQPCTPTPSSITSAWSSSSRPPSAITIRPATSDAGSKPGRGVTPAPSQAAEAGARVDAASSRAVAPARRSRRRGRRRAARRRRCRRRRAGGARRRETRASSSTSRSTPPCSPSPVSTAPTPIVGVGGHAHVRGHEHLDLAHADVERQVACARRGSSTSRRSTLIAPTPISYPSARSATAAGRNVRSPHVPRDVEVGRGDRGEREREHDRGRDQPARAAAERAADEADAARDDQAGDRDPAAERGARRRGREAADGEREQHDADRDLRGDAGRCGSCRRRGRRGSAGRRRRPPRAGHDSSGPTPSRGRGSRARRRRAAPAPTVRARPQRSGGAFGSSVGMKTRQAR